MNIRADMRVKIPDSERSIGENGDGGRAVRAISRERGKKAASEGRVRQKWADDKRTYDKLLRLKKCT